MARSTRLVILIKNIYTLWGRKRFLLPVTSFPTILVHPCTLRVTGIMIKTPCVVQELLIYAKKHVRVPIVVSILGYVGGRQI